MFELSVNCSVYNSNRNDLQHMQYIDNDAYLLTRDDFHLSLTHQSYTSLSTADAVFLLTREYMYYVVRVNLSLISV